MRRAPQRTPADLRPVSSVYGVLSVGRLTDISAAIDHAAGLLATAPFATGHEVINIIGNGRDNVGERAAPAQDRALRRDVTLNALVPDGSDALLEYFRHEVVGGPGAFLIVGPDASIKTLMRRKLVRDLLAASWIRSQDPAPTSSNVAP